MDKLLESGTVQKIDWKRPHDHALAFNADVTRAKNITIAKKSILQPIVFLEDVAAKNFSRKQRNEPALTVIKSNYKYKITDLLILKKSRTVFLRLPRK